MSRLGWTLAQAVVFGGLATSAAHAESAQLLVAEYSPLAASTPGESESCGIEYRTAIQTMKGAQYFVIGSINASYHRGKIPGVVIKVKVSKFANGTITPVKLKHAELRFGADDTSKFKQIPGEDPNTRLLMQVSQDVAFEWLQIVDRVNQGFWITAVGAGLNATFKSPPFADKDLATYGDFAQCQAAALNKYQEWYSTDGGAQ